MLQRKGVNFVVVVVVVVVERGGTCAGGRQRMSRVCGQRLSRVSQQPKIRVADDEDQPFVVAVVVGD